MYKLNFPNGNVQTFNSFGELANAVSALGGTYKFVGPNTYVFVPKK